MFVKIWGELDVELSDLQVLEKTRIDGAVIIERKLDRDELERPFSAQ
jgi:hypothetical protein